MVVFILQPTSLCNSLALLHLEIFSLFKGIDLPPVFDEEILIKMSLFGLLAVSITF